MIRPAAVLRRCMFLAAAGATLLTVTGCPENRESTTVIELVGTVEKIDRNNRRVEVKTFIEKHGQYQTFTVHVTDETEILINGSLATLADVREGERAEGRVRVTKEDDKRVFTALAVNIERGEVLSAPGAAASPPPGGSPAPTAAPGAEIGTSGR